ncbi:MAG: hypothetical protein LBL09_03205 [Oscillospiraceae bacterium]|jgi:hypothetical protein|nr:hypothetical protein [Oscillospiraceae bacterium]
MTSKQTDSFDKIISMLTEDCRESVREVAKYAVSLGYMPALKGSGKNYADFSNSKLNRTILKIQTNPKFPYLEIKFYAVAAYSAFFQKAIEYRLSTWNRLHYETRCFGCGKCDGTEGYMVTLPDGKEGFLCGFGLLPLPSFDAENIAEVREALRLQDEFFRGHVSA